jgi:transposase
VKAYTDWLVERGEGFRAGVKVAKLDPFHGYKNAIADKLQDATAVLDAFHVVKLGTAAVDECAGSSRRPLGIVAAPVTPLSTVK